MKHEFRFPAGRLTADGEVARALAEHLTVADVGVPPEVHQNRRQRRAEAAHGRKEARRVAKILQKQMTREVEARKAKQDAESPVVPVPAVDSPPEG